jgi:UPF0755 protein
MVKTEENMKKTQKIIIGAIAGITIVVLALVFFYFNGQGAVSSKSEEVVVEISGSTSSVLNQLDKAGLLKAKQLLVSIQSLIVIVLKRMFMF